MRKKSMFRAGTLTVILVLVASTAFAAPFPRLHEYHSDGTYSYVIGEEYLPDGCEEEPWSWGQTSNYRKFITFTNCAYRYGSVGCQEYYGGAWHWVPCP